MSSKLIPYGDKVFFDYSDGMRIVCKEHMMRVDELARRSGYAYYSPDDSELSRVRCLEGHVIELDEKPSEIRKYLSRKINLKQYQDAEIFEIDGYLVPASKETQAKAKNSDYFVLTQVKSNPRKGDQVIIYAGKKGAEDKSQIFIDPENRKMTFDQTNINPNDVFVKVEATYRNGSKTIFDYSDKKDENES